MQYVYILVSTKDSNRYYIGITNDLEKRLERHNKSTEPYSKRFAPWYLETYVGFSKKELAYKFEKYLKHGSGHAFLKRHFI